MRYIQRLPREARHVVVQHSPIPRVTFFMPPEKRTVRHFGTGGMRTIDVELPTLMYIWDFELSQLTIYIPRINGGSIEGKICRIGNIEEDGSICWGGERIETRNTPLKAIQSFWESTFNNDLTPMGYVDTSWETFYEVAPNVQVPSERVMDWVAEAKTYFNGQLASRIHEEQMRLHKWREIYNNKAIEKHRENLQVEEYIQIAESLDKDTAILRHRSKLLVELNSRLVESAQRFRNKAHDLSMLSVRFLSQLSAEIEELLLNLQDNKVDPPHLCDWVKTVTLYEQISQYESHEYLVSEAAFRIEELFNSFKHRINEDAYTEWRHSVRVSEEEQWWEEDWLEHGAFSPMDRVIFGEKSDLYEDGCYGVCEVKPHQGAGISPKMPQLVWQESPQFVGVVFQSNRPDIMLAMVAGIPFIGHKKGQGYEWELFKDSTQKGLYQEIEEVFA